MVSRICLLIATCIGVIAVWIAPPPAHAGPYANCSQAKRNGDCDIPRSSPKYDPDLDRDSDGVACEC